MARARTCSSGPRVSGPVPADNEPKTCQQCLESGDSVPTAAMVRSRKYTHGEEVEERERDEKQETTNKRRETRHESKRRKLGRGRRRESVRDEVRGRDRDRDQEKSHQREE